MEKNPETLEELFPCWDSLSEDQRAQVRARTSQRLFEKGSRPHQGRGDCAGLFLLKNGQLRVFILSESGKEITLYRLFAWDICLFSASCIMRDIRFDLHVEAEKDTEAFIVPPDLYDSLTKASLPLANFTSRLISAHFSDIMWTLEQTLFTSFDRRLAGFLLEQSALEDSERLRITHDEIARHLGSAREVVTKMLNYLAAEGLVALGRGQVTLLDKKGLQNLLG